MRSLVALLLLTATSGLHLAPVHHARACTSRRNSILRSSTCTIRMADDDELKVPKDLKAIGDFLKGKRPNKPKSKSWSIFAKPQAKPGENPDEVPDVDYEKMLLFPIPGMKSAAQTIYKGFANPIANRDRDIDTAGPTAAAPENDLEKLRATLQGLKDDGYPAEATAPLEAQIAALEEEEGKA